jgi:protocatechuate 3,4-dioxygenase beta subunit
MKSPTRQFAHAHHHDGGLQDDLQVMMQRNLQRRQALSWLLAGGSAALLVGCGGGGGESATSGSSSSSSSSGGTESAASCIANAPETAGPYPSDGSNTVNGMVSNVLQQSGIVRSDIRSSFGSSTNTAGGVPMTLKLSVVNSNNNCAALSGYAVYLWHCTREGAYSLYSNGVLNENYLRGVQVTDSAGEVTFTSIFPGCYSGRYPHIHFEVYPSLASASLYTNRILTSQMALPRDICSTVYASATGYSSSASNLANVTIANDNVFGDNTTTQMTQMTAALTGSVSAGYDGTILVGVPV